jgi:hypothetical protein
MNAYSRILFPPRRVRRDHRCQRGEAAGASAKVLSTRIARTEREQCVSLHKGECVTGEAALSSLYVGAGLSITMDS